jgi:hypothetical protein
VQPTAHLVDLAQIRTIGRLQALQRVAFARLERPRSVYNYDLDSSSSLSYFNMEQQAQIIQDYYRVLKRLPPEAGHNVGTRKDLSDYQPYVDQLKAAGPFSSPGRPGETADEARDRISRTARGRNAP